MKNLFILATLFAFSVSMVAQAEDAKSEQADEQSEAKEQPAADLTSWKH